MIGLFGLTKVYYKQKRYEEAIKTGKKAYEMAEQSQEMEFVRDVGKELYKSYQKLKNYKVALKYQILYTEAKDSLLNSDKIKEFTRLEMNYVFDKKQALTETENQRKLQREHFMFFWGVRWFAAGIGYWWLYVAKPTNTKA